MEARVQCGEEMRKRVVTQRDVCTIIEKSTMK
jgi:hypothetical protein